MAQKKDKNFDEALELTLKHCLAKKVATDILECPVCWDDINERNIYQCGNGHLLCFRCQDKLQSCPVCRIKLDSRPIRNLALEKLLERLIKQNGVVTGNIINYQNCAQEKALEYKNKSIHLGKSMRSKYVRICCYRCKSRFLCAGDMKFVNCPRPYCKAIINIERPLPIASTNAHSNMSRNSPSANCIPVRALDISNLEPGKSSCTDQGNVSFSIPGRVKPSSFVLGLLGFIAVITVGTIGVTSDTIILSVLVASFSYRNIPHSTSMQKLPTKSDVEKDSTANGEKYSHDSIVVNNCKLLQVIGVAEPKNNCPSSLIWHSQMVDGVQINSSRLKKGRNLERCNRRYPISS